jgi:predicted transcriptional regulator with HTH domain
VHWLLDELKRSGRSDSLNVRGKFPALWKRYLSEKGLKDNIAWN